MTLDNNSVTAETYKCDLERKKHYVKLVFHGAYICGITVMPSKRNPGELMVGMPCYRLGPTWKQYIEFEANSPIKELFERKALEIARAHNCNKEGNYPY